MEERIAEKLRAGRCDGIAAVAELKRSACWAPLLKALDTLRTDRLYQSRLHGLGHVERVMVLGAVIAMQQKFSARETELLLTACSYHDIGRIDERLDAAHGKRSADQLAEMALPGIETSELRCIQAAVATHSTKDAMIDVFAKEYRVPEESAELCRRLCKGLKDADNLDRVRLGDLDVRHLRFPESRELRQTAEELLHLR